MPFGEPLISTVRGEIAPSGNKWEGVPIAVKSCSPARNRPKLEFETTKTTIKLGQHIAKRCVNVRQLFVKDMPSLHISSSSDNLRSFWSAELHAMKDQ